MYQAKHRSLQSLVPASREWVGFRQMDFNFEFPLLRKLEFHFIDFTRPQNSYSPPPCAH